MTTTTQQDEDVPEARKRFEASGIIDISLAQPPTREDVGLEPGERAAIYSSSGREESPYVADFELPNGRNFTSEVVTVIVESDERTIDPCRVEAYLMPTTLDEAKEKLYEFANEFDFPTEEVDAWVPEAQQVSDGGQGPRHGGFEAADIGHIEVFLDAATARGGNRDRVTISLGFVWCDQPQKVQSDTTITT